MGVLFHRLFTLSPAARASWRSTRCSRQDGRTRLEGDASLAAAGSAGSGEVLTGAAGRVLAGVTAGLAALRLILEAALRVELLLTGGKGELVAALFAYQDLVFVHNGFPSL